MYVAHSAMYVAHSAMYSAHIVSDYFDISTHAVVQAISYARIAINNDTFLTWSHNIYKHTLGYGEFSPNWKTSTVRQLVHQIVEHRDFSIFPILADALQDADCNNEELLNHLREDKNERVLSDWVIWNVLGI